MFVTKQDYANRYNICKTCTSFDNTFKMCLECACIMVVKCKLSASDCPKGHWPQSHISIQEQLADID